VVKSLIKILLGGLVVFIALAIVQEWDYFAKSWFGRSNAAVRPTPEASDAAAETVRKTLVLMRHLYQSDGDPRFVERMPLSDALRDELMADIAYLKRNHRRQDPVLQKLEIASVDPLGRDRFEVRTREFWQIKFLSLVDGRPSDEPRWQILHGRYLTVRAGAGWRVESWDFVDGVPPAARGGA